MNINIFKNIIGKKVLWIAGSAVVLAAGLIGFLLFSGEKKQPVSVSFSQETGEDIDVYVDNISAVDFSDDGELMLAASGKGGIMVWEVYEGRQIKYLPTNIPEIQSAVFSSSTNVIACGWKNGTINIYDTERTNQDDSPFIDYSFNAPAALVSLEFAKDGKELISLTEDGQLQYWNTGTGGMFRNADSGLDNLTTAVLSGGGTKIAYTKGGDAYIYDVAAKKEEKRFSGIPGEALSISFNAEQNRLAVSNKDGDIVMWDTSGKGQFEPIKSGTENFALAFNGECTMLLAGSNNGRTFMWDIRSGKNLIQYISFFNPQSKSGMEWIAITQPSGYFNSSPSGAVFKMEINGEMYTMSEVAKQLHRPDRLRDFLHGKDVSNEKVDKTFGIKRPIIELVQSRLPPSTVSTRYTTVAVRAIMPEGEPFQFFVYVNGFSRKTPFFDKSRLLKKPYKEPNGWIAYEQEIDVPVDPGFNKIDISVWDSVFNTAGKPSDKITININSTRQLPPPSTAVLHVLLMAIQEYEDPLLKLKYTINDAQDLKDLFEKQADGVLYDRVVVHPIVTNSDITREKFSAHFDEIKNEVMDVDTFVFFFSGHGDVDDETGEFYFLAHDYPKDGTHPERSIPMSNIVKNILDVQSKHTLVLLDTCMSGAAINSRNGKSAYDKLLMDLENMVILTATGNNQSATERDEIKHGVFTYSILDALNGQINSEGDDRFTDTRTLAEKIKSFNVEAEIAALKKALEENGGEAPELALAGEGRKGLRDNKFRNDDIQTPANLEKGKFRLIDENTTKAKVRITAPVDGTIQILRTQDQKEEGEIGVVAGIPVIQEFKQGYYTLTVTYKGTTTPGGLQKIEVKNGKSYEEDLKSPDYNVVFTVTDIGGTGPAGGIVFYKKSDNSGGWQYLEAAPRSADREAVWTPAQITINGTSGRGKANTQAILNATNRQKGTAAQICDTFSFSGYNDWFLPSIEELEQLRNVASSNSTFSLLNEAYWSSTQASTERAYIVYRGQRTQYSKDETRKVRPVRAF
jgi:WD40 repeat protein